MFSYFNLNHQDERSQIQNKKKALKILGIRYFTDTYITWRRDTFIKPKSLYFTNNMWWCQTYWPFWFTFLSPGNFSSYTLSWYGVCGCYYCFLQSVWLWETEGVGGQIWVALQGGRHGWQVAQDPHIQLPAGSTFIKNVGDIGVHLLQHEVSDLLLWTWNSWLTVWFRLLCDYANTYPLPVPFAFSQDRITDHRIGLTIPGVHRVLSGEELGTILDGLQESDANERLQNFIAQAESMTSDWTNELVGEYYVHLSKIWSTND